MARLPPYRRVAIGLLAAAPLPLVLGPSLTTTFFLGDLWNVTPLPWIPVLALAELAPLWWSRRWPLHALAVTGAAFLIAQSFALPATTADLALLVALFMAGAYEPRRRAAVAVGVTVATLAAFMVLAGGGAAVALVSAALIAALPVLLGSASCVVRREPDPTTISVDSDSFLTPREREILVMIAAGQTNTEIAELLVIGRETVKTHVRNVLAKLGARDRTHAVSIAYDRHLLQASVSRTQPPAAGPPPRHPRPHATGDHAEGVESDSTTSA